MTDNHGCGVEDCTRHPLWGGLCRDHLIIAIGRQTFTKPRKPRKKAAKKKIDAADVLTTDATEQVETRKDDDKE